MAQWIRLRNKAALRQWKRDDSPRPKKARPSEVKDQDNVHFFLRLQRCCARGARFPGSNCQAIGFEMRKERVSGTKESS